MPAAIVATQMSADNRSARLMASILCVVRSSQDAKPPGRPGYLINVSGENMKSTDNHNVQKSEAEWQETLSPQQYQVLRCHGTEMRGSSPLNKEKRDGTFV